MHYLQTITLVWDFRWITKINVRIESILIGVENWSQFF